MSNMAKKQSTVDLVLKWYDKQKAEGKISEPTEAEKAKQDELIEKILKWAEKQKVKESPPEPTPTSEEIVALATQVYKKRKEKPKPEVILEKEPVIELGRIVFKGGGASVYLPKSIREALNLDRKTHTSLVIVADGSKSILLIKDTEVAERLKPMVLDARKAFSDRISQNSPSKA